MYPEYIYDFFASCCEKDWKTVVQQKYDNNEVNWYYSHAKDRREEEDLVIEEFIDVGIDDCDMYKCMFSSKNWISAHGFLWFDLGNYTRVTICINGEDYEYFQFISNDISYQELMFI